MKQKVILDVDTGIDDALGIMLAVNSGEFDILAITTTNGNVSLDQATENTCKVLDLVGATDIPVIKGAARPIVRRPYFEHNVHGTDGIGGALKEVSVQTQVSEGFAPDFIVENVLKYKGQVTLIMTAPLTNLALALYRCPELVDHVKDVVFMGGAVNTFGNVTPTAEYNMYVDPEAAKVVFHSGFPKITLVGLDVTRQVLLTDEHIAQLGDTPIGRYVKESTAGYIQRYEQRHGIRACALHDPLAVGVALRRELVATKRYFVDIETNSELCDGQTICDFQNRLLQTPNMDVCMDVDAESFLSFFIETLRGSN